MLDAMGVLLKAATESIGASIDLCWNEPLFPDGEGWFSIYLHEHFRAFTGHGRTPTEALTMAQDKRLAFQATLATDSTEIAA
jgi:hypothetical protein